MQDGAESDADQQQHDDVGMRVSFDKRLAINASTSRAAGSPKMCAMFIERHSQLEWVVSRHDKCKVRDLSNCLREPHIL